MRHLFYQNALSIFVSLGTICGLTVYVVIPRGGNGAVFFGVAIMLCLLFIAGRLIQELYEQAHTDSLTGLKSRTGFGPMNEKRRSGAGETSSLLMIDVDDFKTINDQFGHHAGDDSLKALAAILRKAVRDKDSVFRWGGDEFVIILPEASMKDAKVIAERIRFSVEAHGLYSMTVSIGAAEIINDNVCNALAMADKAMYDAKGLNKSSASYNPGPEEFTLKTA